MANVPIWQNKWAKYSGINKKTDPHNSSFLSNMCKNPTGPQSLSQSKVRIISYTLLLGSASAIIAESPSHLALIILAITRQWLPAKDTKEGSVYCYYAPVWWGDGVRWLNTEEFPCVRIGMQQMTILFSSPLFTHTSAWLMRSSKPHLQWGKIIFQEPVSLKAKRGTSYVLLISCSPP